MPSLLKEAPVITLGLVLWLVAVGWGSACLWSYQSRPGTSAQAPPDWPAEARLRRAADGPTLVMLAHPRCPCTRASIEELARLMSLGRDRLLAYVLFYLPTGVEEGWERTDQWRSAERIPGVRVLPDQDGATARRFGAETSGQALLYDADGKLVFSGGITPSRGHGGDSLGRAIIAAALRGEPRQERTSPVFGCSLLGPECRPRRTTSP